MVYCGIFCSVRILLHHYDFDFMVTIILCFICLFQVKDFIIMVLVQLIITLICFDSPNQRSGYHNSQICSEDTKVRKEKAIVSISIKEDVLFFPRGTSVISDLPIEMFISFRRSGELFMLDEFVEA